MRIKIKEWCEQNGVLHNGHLVDSGYRLRLALSLNSPTTANQLWKGEMKKIGLDTIQHICRTLGCEPNDLFEFDPPLNKKELGPGVRHSKIAKDKNR